MPLFRKAILKVGKHQSPDGEVNVTRKRLKHWADQFAAMKRVGLSVPVGFDHSDDPKKMVPLSANDERSARDAVGKLRDVQLDPSGDRARIVLDIPDEADAKKARHNVVEVSPVILDEFTDGSGKKWTDCFGHMDLVLHPVDHGQTPFESVPAIACSLRLGIDLSKKKTKGRIYRMAEADVADEKPNDKPGEGDETDKGVLSKVIEELAEMGIVIPEGTTDENFLDHLHTAILTHKATKEAEGNDNDPDNPEEPPVNEASPAIAAMSLRLKGLETRLVNEQRGKLTGRIDTLLKSGRIAPPMAKSLTTRLSATKMALSQNGEPVKASIEETIEALEQLPEGATWDASQRLRMATEQRPPKEMTGEVTDEEAERIVDEMFGKKQPVAT